METHDPAPSKPRKPLIGCRDGGVYKTCLQHCAASDYRPDVRVMERASIIGTRPLR